MGSDQSTQENPNFPIQRYMRPGLTREEVIGLWNVFQSFNPVNGVIEAEQLKKRYKDSYDKASFDNKLGNIKMLDFDKFFDVMSQNIVEKKQKFGGDIEFDYNPQDNAQCVFCPSYQSR